MFLKGRIKLIKNTNRITKLYQKERRPLWSLSGTFCSLFKSGRTQLRWTWYFRYLPSFQLGCQRLSGCPRFYYWNRITKQSTHGLSDEAIQIPNCRCPRILDCKSTHTNGSSLLLWRDRRFHAIYIWTGNPCYHLSWFKNMYFRAFEITPDKKARISQMKSEPCFLTLLSTCQLLLLPLR